MELDAYLKGDCSSSDERLVSISLLRQICTPFSDDQSLPTILLQAQTHKGLRDYYTLISNILQDCVLPAVALGL
eukprot:955149-Amphidinium_carterae.1